MSRTPMHNAASNVRRAAAIIGSSAVVAMAAVYMGVSQHAPETMLSSGGATLTSTTPPTAPEISSAVPLVKAKPYGKG